MALVKELRAQQKKWVHGPTRDIEISNNNYSVQSLHVVATQFKIKDRPQWKTKSCDS